MADPSSAIAQFMVDVGLLDVILPFMLVFTILFGILQKSKALGAHSGKPKTNINAMFAFVVAFFFIASLTRVQILTVIVQKLAIVLVAIISLLLITGLMGGKEVRFLKYKWVIVILFIITLLIFGTSLGWFTLQDLNIIVEWLIHPITVVAVVFILILWLIVREPSSGKKSSSDKPKDKPKKSDGPKSGEPAKQERPRGQPELVNEISGDDLKGEDRVVWKEN